MNSDDHLIGLSATAKRDLLRERLGRELGPRPQPLSFAQERVWFLDRLQPGSPYYNNGFLALISGALDLARLERCLEEIVRRQEALRTSFILSDGAPAQVVAAAQAVTLPVEDLTTAPDPEAAARALAREEAGHCFDLAAPPLFRFRLARLGPERHALILVLHHIVTDGWSMGVFLAELRELYEALGQGRAPALPELPVRYTDFAIWQRRWLRGETLERLLAYWRERLTGAPAPLDLPTDYACGPGGDRAGARHGFLIPPELVRPLRRLAQRESATLYMVLLAAFAALLHRYTGQDDLAIGTPVAGRPRVELEPLIGCFTNTLVMRLQPTPDIIFRDFLARVRETALEAYAHQDLPFDQLVRALRPDRSAGQSPLFQVMFSYGSLPHLKTEFGGLSVGIESVGSDTAQFDLGVEMADTGASIAGFWEYARDLYDAERIAGLAKHYLALLACVAREPERAIADLPLLDTAERKRLLVDWNDTAATPAGAAVGLHDLILAQAAKTPDRVAVVGPEGRLTYGELAGRACRLAHHLRHLGLVPDTAVGVLMDRSLDLVVSLLGIILAGGAYVPLDVEAPPLRLQRILGEAQTPICLAADDLAHRLDGSGVRVVRPIEDGPDIARRPATPPRAEISPGHLVSVYFTSGSTGQPKGVANPHGGWLNRLLWMQDRYRLEPEETVLHKTVITFDDSAVEVFWPLTVGARLALLEPGGHRDPRAILEASARYRAAVLHFVPSMLVLFLEAVRPADRDRLESLRLVVSSGEALRAEVVRLFDERLGGPLGATLVNQWGATEVSIDSTMHQCSPADVARGGVVSVGRPIAGNEAYILDGRLQPVPAGAVGELYLAGVGLARGYLGRPDLTAQAFLPSPFHPGQRMYRTGDRGSYRFDGSIAFWGRDDAQVKIRGQRLELGEVEAVLATHPAVRDCAVVAWKGPEGYRLVAYYATRPEMPVEPDSLRAFLKDRLPDYMVPGRFMRLEEFPLTSSGKLDRRRLPDPDDDRSGLEVEFVAPRTPAEKAVARIWQDVLGAAEVGAEDSFFELGGHSLDAVRVMTRVNGEFGTDLPLKTIFEAQTVAELARRAETAPGAGRDPSTAGQVASSLPRAPRLPSYPLSHAQKRHWLQYQFSPDNALGALFITEALGPLDPEAFGEAYGRVVRRHDLLRTTLEERDGEPVQIVHEVMTPSFRYVDLAGLEAGAQRRRLVDEALAAEQEPFDLTRGPLLRMALYRLAPERYFLFQTIHPVAYDGWSTVVLLRDLGEHYLAASQGRAEALPPALQYADYAVWQNRRLEAGELDGQRNYWRSRLADLPVPPELPRDLAIPPERAEGAGPRSRVIGPGLAAGLRRLALGHGATLYMTLLAGFKLWLALISGQTDVAVCSPFSGRTHPDLETVLGVLVNPVVLRTDLSGNPSFRQMLDRVRQVTLEAQANQDYPFDLVVEDVRSRTGAARSLFNAVFVVQNALDQLPSLGGVTFRDVPPAELLGEKTSFGTGFVDPVMEYDLHVEVFDAGESLKVVTKYPASRFRAGTVDQFLDEWETVLRRVVAEPETRLAELGGGSLSELEALLAAAGQGQDQGGRP